MSYSRETQSHHSGGKNTIAILLPSAVLPSWMGSVSPYSSETQYGIQFLVVLHHFHHLRHSPWRIEDRQQQHILVVLKQSRILEYRIIDVDGWNSVDVQKQVVRSENTLNSNVAKSVRWIDAIHIVHSLSLSCNIRDVWRGSVTDVEWIDDVGSFLLKNERYHISQLVFFNEENSTDGSSPSLHQNGKNLPSVITRMKRKAGDYVKWLTSVTPLKLTLCTSSHEWNDEGMT